MEYTRLGRTGMQVSRICLGCMSYGTAANDGTNPWSLSEDETRPFIKKALEGGINFFDTANAYSQGTSEEFLGRALKEFARREEVVVATKVCLRVRPGPNGAGLSRRAIMEQIDASLRRLGMDHVDLYQIHRWDYETPIEETLEALHDVVKSGKARYIGASSMYAWQFATALGVSARNGWTRFVSMQNLVNLLYREEEREMLPLCAAEGVGVIPYSPLARGYLTRDWDSKTAGQKLTSLVAAGLWRLPTPRRRSLSWSRQLPKSEACHGRRSRWPGFSQNRLLRRRSLARRRCIIWRMRWARLM